jgi:hypothetical protein
MRVFLTRKLAEEIDGISLKGRQVGDVLDLPPNEAHLLLVEEWAMPERRAQPRSSQSHDESRAVPTQR